MKKVATLSITEHETEDESSESDAENGGEVPVTKGSAEGRKGGRSRRKQRKSDGNRVIPQKSYNFINISFTFTIYNYRVIRQVLFICRKTSVMKKGNCYEL